MSSSFLELFRGPLQTSREERSDPRLAVSREVQITLLEAEETQLEAQVIDYSAARITVRTVRPVPPGAGARIESDDWRIVGKIVYCRQEASHFVVGLQIEQWQPRLSQFSAIEEVEEVKDRERRL